MLGNLSFEKEKMKGVPRKSVEPRDNQMGGLTGSNRRNGTGQHFPVLWSR
jgi:hypothetical protein